MQNMKRDWSHLATYLIMSPSEEEMKRIFLLGHFHYIALLIKNRFSWDSKWWTFNSLSIKQVNIWYFGHVRVSVLGLKWQSLAHQRPLLYYWVHKLILKCIATDFLRVLADLKQPLVTVEVCMIQTIGDLKWSVWFARGHINGTKVMIIHVSLRATLFISASAPWLCLLQPLLPRCVLFSYSAIAPL